MVRRCRCWVLEHRGVHELRVLGGVAIVNDSDCFVKSRDGQRYICGSIEVQREEVER